MSGPFQVMPPLSPEEYEALKADIAANGITVPVVYDQHDRIIDGHHRLQIAAELGIESDDIPWVCRDVANAQEARSIAYSLNLHRRHLTREQRRELLAASLKADPELSDREHGQRVGASKNTAAAVREELEATGQVDQLAERVGADGKVRPAHVTTTMRTTEATKVEQDVDLITGEIHDRDWAVSAWPVLDVPGAPDDEVVKIAEAVATRPTAEQDTRAENGAKWLAAYVRRGGPTTYEDPPALVAARIFARLADTTVRLGREYDAVLAGFDEGDALQRAQWAGVTTGLLQRITELHAHVTAPLSLRSVK